MKNILHYMVSIVFWPYRKYLVKNIWNCFTEEYGYYKWRILGADALVDFMRDGHNCRHYSFGSFKKYKHFCWVLNSLSEGNILCNFLHTNTWIMDNREHLNYLRKWILYDNKSYKPDAIFDEISRSPNVTKWIYSDFHHVLNWDVENLYERFPRELIEIDWGNNFEVFSNVINWKLASRIFNFLDERNLKDFKRYLDVDMLRLNPNVNMALVRKIFEIEQYQGDLIDNLPDGVVKITDEIYSNGKEIWIFKDGKYLLDNPV